MKKFCLAASVVGVLNFAMVGAAVAAFPERPITIVVGYAPGGTTDILARAIAEQLGKNLKTSVIIENRAGAAGNLAAAMVEKATPDGYTLFVATVSSHGINPAIYNRNLGYRPVEGFAPVGMVASIPLLLVTNPKLGFSTVDQLVNAAKEKPGQLNYSSSGNGSPVHMAGAMFARAAGVEIVHVPYRGGALANTSVMSGETQFTFATMPAALPQVKAGALEAVAVTTANRSDQLPDTPAVAEASGFSGYEINTWNALMAPSGTPPETIATLNNAIAEILKTPALKERFEREGATPQWMSPSDTGKFIDQELAKWKETSDRLKIEIQ